MKYLFILSICCLNLTLLIFTSEVKANKIPNKHQFPNLEHPDPEKKVLEINNFARKVSSRDTNNLAILIGYLYDEEILVRKQVIFDLIRIQPADPHAQQLLIQALDASNIEARIAAAWIISAIPIKNNSEIIQILLKSLEHNHIEVRRSAARALGSLQPKELIVRQKLIQALEDPSDEVRVAAKWAIKQINSFLQKNNLWERLSCLSLFKS